MDKLIFGKLQSIFRDCKDKDNCAKVEFKDVSRHPVLNESVYSFRYDKINELTYILFKIIGEEKAYDQFPLSYLNSIAFDKTVLNSEELMTISNNDNYFDGLTEYKGIK